MLDVIFEDNHILVVVKPQNIPSQEDESMDENMVSLVKKYLKEKYARKLGFGCSRTNKWCKKGNFKLSSA